MCRVFILCLAALVTSARGQVCKGQADIIFVIDSSGSVGQDNFDQTLAFVNAIINELEVGSEFTRVGVLTFESVAVKRFDLNRYFEKTPMMNAVTNIPFIFGSTATFEGLQLMLDMFSPAFGDRPDVDNIGIVITDGNAKTGDPIPKAQEAIDLGINMFAIAVNTGELDVDQIKPLASNEETNYFEVTDFTQLSNIVDAVAKGACTFEPICPGTQADVAFVIDSSGSITAENFLMIKEFVISVVSDLDIGPDNIRVGAISFSNIARSEFLLNAFTSAENVVNSVDAITQIGAGTQTNLALDLLISEFFTTANGDRTYAPNLAFVITDGVSDDSTLTANSALAAQNAGIDIFSIGIGDTNNLDIAELNTIASDPDFAFVKIIGDFTTLKNISREVALQTCFDPVCQGRQADVVFVLDASGSITADNFAVLKNFVKTVVNRLDVGTGTAHIGAITFSSGTDIFWQLNTHQNKSNVIEAIDGITQAGGTTHTAEAIQVARTVMFTEANGDRPVVPNILILVTDGESKDADPIPEATLAKAAGITIFCLGIGQDFGPAGEAELRAIASSPISEHLYSVNDFADLASIAGEISQVACYADVCGNQKYDMVFILDRSGSVPDDDYLVMLDFVSSMVNELDISPDQVQMSVITFSSDVIIEWSLTRYTSRNSLRNAIVALNTQTDGATNHADALAAAIDVVFQPANGDRADADNIIIILTDGRSTVNAERTLTEASRAKSAASVFAIGIGPELTITDLNAIASTPSSRYVFQVTNFLELNTIRNTLLDFICNPLDNMCRGKGDIILAVDSSGSIGEANFVVLQTFLQTLLLELDIGSSANLVGLLSFADNAAQQFQLNDFTDRDQMINQMLQVPYTKGATHTSDALNAARAMFSVSNGDRSDVPNIVVVITDGVSTVNKADTIPAAIDAKNEGIAIATVAIGTAVDDKELTDMASETGLMFSANSFNDLQDIVTSIRTAICNDVNECDSSPCQNGGQCFDRLGYYQCECPDGFSGYNCEQNCNEQIDLVFAVDSSGSIFADNFDLIKHFVGSIILDLPVFQTGTRVGLITFASTARIQWQLNQYSRRDAINALRSVPYTGGATNIADALQLIRLSMFTNGNGDRDFVQNVVVLITDGASNVNAGDTLPQARLLRNSGAHVMVVGVGNELSPFELRGMATDPDSDNVMSVASFAELATLRSAIISPTCFDANECQNNPCQGGAACIDGINRYECICPEGRAGKNCEIICDGQADVIFVVDSSGSIGDVNFEKVTNFVQSVAGNLEVTNARFRVGLATFADDGEMRFQLDDYSTRSNILNAITSIPYTKGATNAARGLELMRAMFSVSNGDRPGIPNVAVVIADGIPTVRKGEEVGQADAAKSAGVTIKTIGVGPNVRADILESLSSAPSSFNSQIVADFDDLATIVSSLASDICQFQ